MNMLRPLAFRLRSAGRSGGRNDLLTNRGPMEWIIGARC
jgi:hypothetical protein